MSDQVYSHKESVPSIPVSLTGIKGFQLWLRKCLHIPVRSPWLSCHSIVHCLIEQLQFFSVWHYHFCQPVSWLLSLKRDLFRFRHMHGISDYYSILAWIPHIIYDYVDIVQIVLLYYNIDSITSNILLLIRIKIWSFYMLIVVFSFSFSSLLLNITSCP